MISPFSVRKEQAGGHCAALWKVPAKNHYKEKKTRRGSGGGEVIEEDTNEGVYRRRLSNEVIRRRVV